MLSKLFGAIILAGIFSVPGAVVQDTTDVAVQLTLGNAYYYGDGVPRDLAIAAKWDRKAAEQGNARGQYRLGNDFFSAKGFLRTKLQV